MNDNLHRAKAAKNDEFYTQLSDIEKELSNYPADTFKNKIIYCPCDVGVDGLDIHKSNFVKYFEMNKERLGYKQLLHTSLQEGYDFHSDYCTRLLNEADIVVTNPPFSLFRDFFKWLMQCPDKRFIVLSSQNAVTYKEVFPYIRDNKVWLGNVNMGCPLLFNVSEEAQKELRDTKQEGKGYKIKDGEIKARVPAIWFTNCDYNARYEDNILVEKYSPDKYPKYDNYDVIEVSKINKIPLDYDGVMGVPISFLSHHNPKQFDIVALRRNPDGTVEPWTVERERESSMIPSSVMTIDGLMNNPKDTTINGKSTYARVLIQKKCQ